MVLVLGVALLGGEEALVGAAFADGGAGLRVALGAVALVGVADAVAVQPGVAVAALEMDRDPRPPPAPGSAILICDAVMCLAFIRKCSPTPYKLLASSGKVFRECQVGLCRKTR